MDDFSEQIEIFLKQRVQEVKGRHKNLTRAEKKAQMETMDRILHSLPDRDREWLDTQMTEDVILTEDVCRALYLAGLQDGLRLLKLITA